MTGPKSDFSRTYGGFIDENESNSKSSKYASLALEKDPNHPKSLVVSAMTSFWNNNWDLKIADSLTIDRQNWTHDADADIVHDSRGMTVSTNKYIDVVWLKQDLPKNFLIAYEWTSLQTGRSLTSIREPLASNLQNGLNACVLYLHANGAKGKAQNVLDWSFERKTGFATYYQDFMSNVRPLITVRKHGATVLFPKC